MGYIETMQSVIETTPYLNRAKSLLSEEERFWVVDFIAANPTSGDLMAGTGGVRKVRVPLGNRGKSGGARVIYFYFDETAPIYLFAIYTKAEKANLTDAECNALKSVTDAIKAEYRRIK